jgi:hypothetical protein
MKIAMLTCGLLTAALMGPAHAATLLPLSEGFDDITTLGAKGWIFQNDSSPPAGVDWFQGNDGIFAAQSGAANSYIASSFLAAPPAGFIDNFLITPSFSLESNVTLTFWARGDVIDGFSDSFAVVAGTTANGNPEVVTQVLADTVALGNWTRYTVVLAGQGAGVTGRFGFEYFGLADTSNYIGIDTVKVVAVPEPQTYALMALGVAALALRRRKSAS